MGNTDIPADIKVIAAEVFARIQAMVWDTDSEIFFEDTLGEIERAILAERERCAKLIDCDCNNYCDLKEAAEKIRGDRSRPL